MSDRESHDFSHGRDANPPRVLVAGTHSGVGKTTVATGIMAALTERGRRASRQGRS